MQVIYISYNLKDTFEFTLKKDYYKRGNVGNLIVDSTVLSSSRQNVVRVILFEVVIWKVENKWEITKKS